MDKMILKLIGHLVHHISCDFVHGVLAKHQALELGSS